MDKWYEEKNKLGTTYLNRLGMDMNSSLTDLKLD
jgi:hypothetical protein